MIERQTYANILVLTDDESVVEVYITDTSLEEFTEAFGASLSACKNSANTIPKGAVNANKAQRSPLIQDDLLEQQETVLITSHSNQSVVFPDEFADDFEDNSNKWVVLEDPDQGE